MKVKDLIEKLRQYDENETIIFGCSIENGRGLSYVCEGEIDIELTEEYEYEVNDDYFENEHYDGIGEYDEEEGVLRFGKVLCINIDGEQTGFQ